MFRTHFRKRSSSGKTSWALPVAAFCIVLTGCTSSPKNFAYTEPMASISGTSLIHGEKSSDGASYLLAVDGMAVHNSVCGYDRQTRVVGGSHSFEVGFVNGLYYTRTKLFATIPHNEELVIKHQVEKVPDQPPENSFESPEETTGVATLWLESKQTGTRYAQTRPAKLFIHPNVFEFPFVINTIGVLVRDCP
jgi:hypothetical protein